MPMMPKVSPGISPHLMHGSVDSSRAAAFRDLIPTAHPESVFFEFKIQFVINYDRTMVLSSAFQSCRAAPAGLGSPGTQSASG